jgi:tetratricopeptide (TPR) repeat protein
MARGEKKKARAEIKTLQEQFPNDPSLYFVKGTMHRLDGEYEQSLKAFEKLAKLDPAARVVAAYNRSRVFIYQDRFEEAMKEIEKGLKIERNHPMLRIFHSAALFHSGKREEAVEKMKGVLSDNPEMDGIRPLLAVYLAGTGKADEARAELSGDALALAKSDHDMAYWAGEAYALLGEKDLAFKWLNRAVRLGNENKYWYEHDKTLASIRDDERFAELIRLIEKKD